MTAPEAPSPAATPARASWRERLELAVALQQGRDGIGDQPSGSYQRPCHTRAARC
jgi:hypothetical protein